MPWTPGAEHPFEYEFFACRDYVLMRGHPPPGASRVYAVRYLYACCELA